MALAEQWNAVQYDQDAAVPDDGPMLSGSGRHWYFLQQFCSGPEATSASADLAADVIDLRDAASIDAVIDLRRSEPAPAPAEVVEDRIHVGGLALDLRAALHRSRR